MSGEIVFVHSRLTMGGAERLRLSLLRELYRRGIPSRVCLLQEYGELVAPIRAVGFPVDVLDTSTSLYSISTQLKLRKYLSLHQPRIVHAGQFVTNVHVTAAVKSLRQCPVIIEEHGHCRWKKWHHRILDRAICRRADAVLCCSQSVQRHAQPINRIPSEQYFPIHNCVDPSAITASQDLPPNDLRKKLGIPPDSFVVGTIGKLRTEKGHTHLIEAWRRFVSATEGPCHLLIVGDGPLSQALKEQAKGLPGVIWAGQSNDVAKHLSLMDVFAFPSVDEGLGIALLEAMHAGKAVVASDTGGIPEILVHNQNGLLCPPGDPAQLADRLLQLQADTAMCQKLADAGRKYVFANNTPAVYCDSVLEMHSNLLSNAGSENATALEPLAA